MIITIDDIKKALKPLAQARGRLDGDRLSILVMLSDIRRAQAVMAEIDGMQVLPKASKEKP